MLRLMKLLPTICELVLNNVNFMGSRIHGVDYSNQDILYNIIESPRRKIMKLKISNINLNLCSTKLVKNIINVIRISKNIIFIDLSWTKLLAYDLAKIAESLHYNSAVLRNLNLSYNKLNSNPSNPNDKQVMFS